MTSWYRAELTTYLGSAFDAFDAIVSADTLVYFGPLEEVVAAGAQALRAGGHFIFTVEESDDADYSLGLHGRYRHSRAYLESTLEAAGLRPEIVSAELRLEAGEAVRGLVVSGTRPAER